MNESAPMPPIFVASLFRDVSNQLIALLQTLGADEWNRPTLSSERKVKDIAAHLLDGSLRRLSMQRDNFRSSDGSSQVQPGETILDFLNRLNSEWETATRRLSPRVLIELLQWADVQLAALFESLDPFAPAIFPVAWAGEEQSQNWLDIARDYTEKWHHTQQIFEATGHPSTITEPRLFHPCLDIFMRALPFTYRKVEASEGTLLTVEITTAAGGKWYLRHTDNRWHQLLKSDETPQAVVSMSADTAWKLFTKRRALTAAISLFPDIQIVGDRQLGSHVMTMVSVMA